MSPRDAAGDPGRKARWWMVAVLAAGLAPSFRPARAQTADGKLPRRATCPIDSKAFEVTPQSPVIYVNGAPRIFCAPACRDRFASRPETYVKETVYCTVQTWFKGWIQTGRRVELNNNLYYLCCEPCVGWLRDKPWLYLKEAQDPVNRRWFKLTEQTPKSVARNQVYLFENVESKAQFDREPEKYIVAFRR